MGFRNEQSFYFLSSNSIFVAGFFPFVSFIETFFLIRDKDSLSYCFNCQFYYPYISIHLEGKIEALFLLKYY